MFGKFCLRTIVGVALFCIFGGKDALGMLAMAVVCTFGLGLLVVVPAAYLIGLLCTIWFIPFGRPAEKTAPRAGGTSRNSALAEYISQAEIKGRSWPSIRDELLSQGWDANTIANARGRSGATRESSH